MKKLLGKKVLFLGDSITEGANASSEEKCFVNVFGALSGAQVYNYGIGGTRIAHQTNPTLENPRYDIYFAARVQDMRVDSDYIVVFGGTNDFWTGDAPLGKFGDKTPKTFYGGLYDLYKRLKEKYPQTLIFAVTPLHRDNEEKEVNGSGCERKGGLESYVEAVKKVAQKFNIPVADAYHDWDMKPIADKQNEVYFSADGLHPNDKGHQLIAEKLLTFIGENI